MHPLRQTKLLQNHLCTLTPTMSRHKASSSQTNSRTSRGLPVLLANDVRDSKDILAVARGDCTNAQVSWITCFVSPYACGSDPTLGPALMKYF